MRRPKQRCSDIAPIRAFLIAVCCALSALTVLAQSVASIVGQVRTENGRVITSGVTLKLETTEGMPVVEQPANSEGQFAFQNLRKISYRLTVTAPGFQPVEKQVDLGYGANQVIVNLFLAPESKAKVVAASVPALTDIRAPSKARKEYEKGAHALAQKDLGEARAQFELAVADYPCYARAQTDLALTLSASQEWSRAEAALKKAIECDPAYLDAYTQLGQIFNAQKRFQESESLLRQGLRYSGSVWQLFYQLGVADYGLGQYPKAQEDFLRVVSLNPAPPAELHVKLADVYLKQDAYQKAYQEMQTYLGADSKGRFAPKIKKIMREMEAAGVLQAAKSLPTNYPPETKP